MQSKTSKTSKPVGRQERSVRTERVLLDTLEALLASRTIQELSVAEIARHAGLTLGDADPAAPEALPAYNRTRED